MMVDFLISQKYPIGKDCWNIIFQKKAELETVERFYQVLKQINYLQYCEASIDYRSSLVCLRIKSMKYMRPRNYIKLRDEILNS